MGSLAMDTDAQADLDSMIEAAAHAADYVDGFGIAECDLDGDDLWAVYARQSTEEQRLNNRLPEYLLTCAQEAKRLGVIVPREYVLYDAVTGEHLDRPMMRTLRHELAAGRKIAGVIFPALDRLSREPMHIGVFEFELDYLGVRYHYADAPNGGDPASQMVRQNLAYMAKFVKLVNRKNNRAGNVGRVLKGLAPAHRAPYGYAYRAEYRDDGPRRIVTNAWWEVDATDEAGGLIEGSPAWIVHQVFVWLGEEGRTLHWVTRKLNDLNVLTTERARWNPAKLHRLVKRTAYYGEHIYNHYVRIPDPSKPPGDITGEIRRTRTREKPETDWVRLQVPALVSRELWEAANAALKERGRGRGREGRKLEVLLRGRLFCPRCGKSMIVRRAGKNSGTYYYCSKYHSPVSAQRCAFRRFIPASWDEVIWNDVCALLRDDEWVEAQMRSPARADQGIRRLARAERAKIAQATAKISRVREGYEGGIYSLEDAKTRLAELEHEVRRSRQALERLEARANSARRGAAEVEVVREELRRLRDRNLDEATFGQRVDLVARLGVAVYPSEDLTSAKVTCRLTPGDNGGTVASNRNQGPPEPATSSTPEGRRVTFTPPYGTNVLQELRAGEANWTLRSPAGSSPVTAFGNARAAASLPANQLGLAPTPKPVRHTRLRAVQPQLLHDPSYVEVAVILFDTTIRAHAQDLTHWDLYEFPCGRDGVARLDFQRAGIGGTNGELVGAPLS